MEQISVEKRNEIAFELITHLAMNRKPDADFLDIFESKRSPEEKRKVRNDFLKKYSFDDLKSFLKILFDEAYSRNIELFSETYDQNIADLKRKEAGEAQDRSQHGDRMYG